MFNIYSFEKKIKQEDDVKETEQKEKRIMSTHRKTRDVLAENYQKRVASFIREMVDSPVANNDEYSIRTTLLSSKNRNKFKSMEFSSIDNDDKELSQTMKTAGTTKNSHNRRYKNDKSNKSTNSSFQQPTPDFRYASFRTEKERIANNIKINQQFCDSVPNPDKFGFHKSLRARRESKELGPQFRFTAKSGIERIYDQLSTRMTSAFQTRELASDKLSSTIRDRNRQNQTISPNQLLPSIHHKTHFKAATSLFLKTSLENSLKDKTNCLSRALRDVSPNFANMSVDHAQAINGRNNMSINTSPINQVQPIIKGTSTIKGQNNAHMVKFREDLVGEYAAKAANKQADNTTSNTTPVASTAHIDKSFSQQGKISHLICVLICIF
jgi:hypothetical protein